jgi:hypothetical protein
MAKGHCLCGAVTYEGKGAPHLHICHCADCRRWTGGPMMGVRFDDGIEIAAPDKVGWYKSSEWAERGSCSACGTSLFYRVQGMGTIIATAGTLDDPPPAMTNAEHIFCDSKPAYYEFSGDAPRVTGAEVFARYSGSGS